VIAECFLTVLTAARLLYKENRRLTSVTWIWLKFDSVKVVEVVAYLLSSCRVIVWTQKYVWHAVCHKRPVVCKSRGHYQEVCNTETSTIPSWQLCRLFVDGYRQPCAICWRYWLSTVCLLCYLQQWRSLHIMYTLLECTAI